MNRCGTLCALVALGCASLPHAAHAQPAEKVWRVGNVNGVSAPVAKPYEDAFLSGMKERGYVVGRNLIFDTRHADGDPARYPALVDEVVALRPDVLVGANTAVALLMKSRTRTIPIVLATSGDPVGDGLVQSLARPGGNVTGVSLQLSEVGAKHIELMGELLPRMRRVALLTDPSASKVQIEQYEKLATAAAAAKGYGTQIYHIHSRSDIREIFRRMEAQRPDALVLFLSPRLNAFRRELSQRAIELRLPSIAHQDGFAQDGGLMSFGPSFVEGWRRVPYFVDRILKGTKPADLPIEQPTKFTLLINAKTAKALDLTVPGSILLRADRVIE
jgi:ABC-type uncharacterized transport system substrate-binding protein